MLVVALALFVVAVNPVAAQQGIQDIWSAVMLHSTLEVQGATTFDSTTAHTGAATFASTVDVTGDVNVGSFLDLSSSSVVTVTAVGGAGAAVTYTPTTSLVHLNSATAITLTLGLVEAGRVLWLTNDDNVTMLFPDSGNQALGGARSLTQYDSLVLLSVGTGWREISFVAN